MLSRDRDLIVQDVRREVWRDARDDEDEAAVRARLGSHELPGGGERGSGEFNVGQSQEIPARL